MGYLEQLNSHRRRIEQRLPEARGKGRTGSLMSTDFEMMKNFWKWIVVMASKHSECGGRVQLSGSVCF